MCPPMPIGFFDRLCRARGLGTNGSNPRVVDRDGERSGCQRLKAPPTSWPKLPLAARRTVKNSCSHGFWRFRPAACRVALGRHIALLLQRRRSTSFRPRFTPCGGMILSTTRRSPSFKDSGKFHHHSSQGTAALAGGTLRRRRSCFTAPAQQTPLNGRRRKAEAGAVAASTLPQRMPTAAAFSIEGCGGFTGDGTPKQLATRLTGWERIRGTPDTVFIRFNAAVISSGRQ